MDYINPIRETLEQSMHELCNAFMLIGFPHETPRYFNFKSFDNETGKLQVGSTQSSKLFFEVDTPFKYVYVNDFWEQFKEFRTSFLKQNYPTIKFK